MFGVCERVDSFTYLPYYSIRYRFTAELFENIILNVKLCGNRRTQSGTSSPVYVTSYGNFRCRNATFRYSSKNR